MREKNIEQKLVQAVKAMGGIAPKFVSPGFDGMPDRLVLLPQGIIAFVEVKRHGEKPRPLQEARHGLLRRLGFEVYVLDDVENAHEAIIEPVVFDMVQQEMARRKSGKNRHSGVGMFASRIKCGECGSWYGSKVWHSTSKYRRTIYRCNNKFNGEVKCKTPHLDEDTIKRLFVSAANKLLADKGEIISNFALMRNDLFGTDDLEAERTALHEETVVVAELIQKCIEENARTALDQNEYQERYEGLVLRFDTAKARFEEVSELVTDKKARCELVEAFTAELARQDGLLAEFDERLWFSLVDFVTVYGEDDLRFTFKDGTEITA